MEVPMEKRKSVKVVKTVKKVAPVKKEVVTAKKVTARAASPKIIERKPAKKILTAEGWKRRKMRERE